MVGGSAGVTPQLYVKSRSGVIQSVPNGKGEVAILSNSMRLMVHWQQLRPPAQATNPTTEIARRVGGEVV